MKRNISKTQFYIGLSVVVLTFAGINLIENNVGPVFAQVDPTVTHVLTDMYR